MVQKTKMMKKSLFSMMLVVILAFAFAIPASAASYSYSFYNPDTGATSTHASSFINGAAEVTGTAGNYTVTIKLHNWYQYIIPVSYNYLQIDTDNDGVYEVNATKTTTSSYTQFTFSGVDNVVDHLPIKLQVTVAGVHNTVYDLEIDWGS